MIRRSSACEICRKPVADSAAICSHCWRAGAGRSLHVASWIGAQLDVTLARQTATGERVGSRSTSRALPFDPRAAEALHHLRHILSSWVRLVADERNLTIAIENRTAPMSQFLIRSNEFLRHHEAALAFTAELRDATRDAIHAIDLTPWVARFPVGPCPELVDEQPCTGTIHAYVVPHNIDKPSLLTCSSCGATYDTTQWHRAGRRILARKAAMA